MIKVTIDNINLYRFSFLEQFPFVTAAFFGRFGGVSGSNKNELNLAFNEKDDVKNVLTNIKKAEKTLSLKNTFYTKQTHSKNVYLINKKNYYQINSPFDLINNYDALVTKEYEIPLLIKLADCQGILLLEPKMKILALIHSGWRGSVKNIIGETINFLKESFSVDAKNLWAGIGPSLGPCCAEFKNYKTELPEFFWDFKEGNYFNFWEISKKQLIDAGLMGNKIEVMKICTKCNLDFFSYRRLDKYNRFGIIVALRK